MKLRWTSVALLVGQAVVAVAINAASAAEWGTLTGRIIFEGTAPTPTPIVPNKDPEYCGKHKLINEELIVGPSNGLDNAVIWLRTKKPEVHPDFQKTAKDTVVLDNKYCRFEPHVLVFRTGQTLKIKNSDTVGHNSKIDGINNPAINVIIASGQSSDQKLPNEEGVPAKVGCNIHPWMGGWIVVRNDPYAAVSDENGNFKIENLPAGKELEFQLWQEKVGNLKTAKIKGIKVDGKGRFKYKVKSGDNDLGEIKVKI